jgi:sigma-B regulation protein RsbU (phosphoserine phosphatase)
LVPAREVGGDIFDYYIRDEKLFFCIGDVSGKGTAAAMLMGVIHSMFRSFSLRENNPTRIMQSINELSCEGNDSNMFVTFFLGVLDLPTGRLRYCDAGHDSPYIIHNSEIFRLDCIAHLPVGVLDDMKYTTQEIQLQPDSTIFLYTDGLTEAMDQEHKQFGLDRVEKILSTLTDENPEQVLQKVTEAMHEFVKDAEQSDDLTMLAVHYTPQSFGSTLTETLVLKNDIHEVSKLSSFMKSVTEKINLEASLSRQLRLAVEEAVVNVIDYAYPNEKDGEVEVCMMFNGQSLKIIITDSGVPFDPTAKEKADTTLSAEDRQIGGLGILLVRELMDSINYEREEGKNILTLTKTIHNS